MVIFKLGTMKTKILVLLIGMMFNVLFGQKSNRVKIEYSYMSSIFLEHEDGDYILHSESFGVNRVGLSYDRKLYKWFRAEMGIDFIFSNYTTEFQGIPNFIERDDSFFMVSFPVILSIEFASFFYIKGGLLVDFQTNESKNSDKQSGIGGMLGLGAKYDYQDYTFSIGIENRRRRLKSFTKLNNFPNYLHHYGITASFGYNF